MKVRRLTDDGVRQFEEFVESLRQGGSQNTPTFLLDDVNASEALSVDLEVDLRAFDNRYELGVYLSDVFSNIEMQSFYGDRGFWSWLGLYWFDQLCPMKPDGKRKPQMSYSYVLSDKWTHRPRHAIFTTWQLVSLYGEDARFLLSRELPVRGELIEQMTARQYFLSCDGVIRLASRLYYDDERETFKRGAAARKSAGCVYRYIGWLQQLEVNYDLYSVTADELMSFLPAEFSRFVDA
jgi:hypothetical protein